MFFRCGNNPVNLQCKNKINHYTWQSFKKSKGGVFFSKLLSDHGSAVHTMEVKVQSLCVVNGKYRFEATETSWHTAEQTIKTLLLWQQSSDLICHLRLYPFGGERNRSETPTERISTHMVITLPAVLICNLTLLGCLAGMQTRVGLSKSSSELISARSTAGWLTASPLVSRGKTRLWNTI